MKRMTNPPDHDSLCSYPSSGMCSCNFIAVIRADERSMIVERLLLLHGDDGSGLCAHCQRPNASFPCLTLRALGGEFV